MTEKKILLTRPLEDSASMQLILDSMGIASVISPLLRIEVIPLPPLFTETLRNAPPQGIILTSKHAASALPGLGVPLATPVFAVGEATAESVRAQGFKVVTSSTGNAEQLVKHIVMASSTRLNPLVYLRGEDVAFDMEGSLKQHALPLISVCVYRTVHSDSLTTETLQHLESGLISGIVFFSAATARIYRGLIEDAGLEYYHNKVVAICISDDVRQVLDGIPFKESIVSPKPGLEYVIDTIRLHVFAA
jgi:uroporphyrinogen-III synthase